MDSYRVSVKSSAEISTEREERRRTHNMNYVPMALKDGKLGETPRQRRSVAPFLGRKILIHARAGTRICGAVGGTDGWISLRGNSSSLPDLSLWVSRRPLLRR